MKYDEFGRELPDPTPVEMPLNFKRPVPMAELIRRTIRTELSRRAEQAGFESFDESDDFDVDDDVEPVSPYEMTVMQEEGRMPKDRDKLEKPEKGAGKDGAKRDEGVEGAGSAVEVGGKVEGAKGAESKAVGGDSEKKAGVTR